MSKYKKGTFKTSLENSLRGIRILWKSERNFRTHCIIALLVIILAMVMQIDADEISVLILTIGMVLLSEMFNSAIEFTLDAVYKNKYSKLVGMAKDISAGAVTVSAIISVIVGVLIFGHQIFF